MAAIGNGVLLFALFFMVNSDDSCDVEIENTLKALLTPTEYPTMQQQALRKDLLRRFQEALDRVNEQDDLNYKRSLSSLAHWNNLPNKRNIEALARAGYFRTLPEPDEDDSSNKRSLGNQKNEENSDMVTENKRGIESLARNGELHTRRDIQQLLEELQNKRNIGSLARNFNLPSYGKRYIGSVLREGNYQYGKRNVAALARDGIRLGKRNVHEALEDKRNIGSIKAQYPPENQKTRSKRQTYYSDENGELPSPVFQDQNDYDEIARALTEAYPNNDKRFLGSVARSGWFRPTSRYQSQTMEKRHIGALARLGWLPTLRNVRRFNRSGRSTSLEGCREVASDGQTEDNSISENTLSLEDKKRFLLQPIVDRILLRKMFIHPRSHHLLANLS